MVTSIRSLALGVAVAILTVSTLTACGADAAGSEGDDVVVVATTTPLGSVMDEIAQCAGGESVTLMGPGDDPHDFSPSSQQVVSMATADVVVANGLGLEASLENAMESAESDGARILEVAPEVDPLPFGEEEEHADEHEGEDSDEHEHEGEDPHFWLDAGRMATAATVIGDEVSQATGDDAWTRCGSEVAEELEQTDTEVREILSDVPMDQRVLVTDHEAFGYFAEAYDFRIAGVVIPGGSTDAEPSSADVAALVDVVRDEGVPALFTNTAVSSKLVDAVAAEAGQDVQVVPLYVGSVGEHGGPAADYPGMVTENARAVAAALT